VIDLARESPHYAAVLAAFRCPECTAPVRTLPSAGQPVACAYCGAVFAIATPAAQRTEERFSIAVRAGPSNVDRVARVLHDHAGVDLATARARLERPPFEIDLGPNEGHARAVAEAAVEGGAVVEVISRSVPVALRTVTLEDVGANKLAVIAAIRGEVDLSVVEAKRLVAEAPTVVVTGVDDTHARALVAALEAAGAKATAR
jgi:large subunit ribosomal protein L7/L12